MYRIIIFVLMFFTLFNQTLAQKSNNQKRIDALKVEINRYKDKNPERAAENCLELADFCFGIGKRKESRIYYKRTIEYTTSLETKYQAYKGIYYSYKDKDKYNRNRISYLKQTIIYADSAGRSAQNRLEYRKDLCEAYLYFTEYDSTIEIGKQVLELSFITGNIEAAQETIKSIIEAYKVIGPVAMVNEYSAMLKISNIEDIFNKYRSIVNKTSYLNKLYADFISFKKEIKNQPLSEKYIKMDNSISGMIQNLFESADSVLLIKIKLSSEIDTLNTTMVRMKVENKNLINLNKKYIGIVILIFVLLSFALWAYFVKKKQHTLLNQQKYKIELQARELNTKNGELTKAFDHLKNTQNQLVQTEKMASLGQLIAGIAHELNTPLGAIKSSIGTVIESSSKAILLIPELVKTISNEEFKLFTDLMEQGMQSTRHYTSREERAIKKRLRVQLESFKVGNHRSLADSLTDIGIHEIDEKFLPLLNSKYVDMIMAAAYNLIIQNENGRNIKIAVDRASKIIFALKSYSYTTQKEEMVMSNITNNIETVLTIYHNQLKHGIDVERKFDNLPEIKCFPDELSQVWTNIIHNAIQAMDSKGKLTISAQKEKNNILVSFTDTGKGIPKDIQDKIFEPFFTTKAEGEGTGLGLDIIRKIVEKHNGSITFKSKEGIGTTFYVKLPIV